MATHRFILSAGHRNEDRGGAFGEIDWTYGSCLVLKAEIEKRGGKAWIVQEHDGDSDPTFCRGRGLQNAARRCVELASQFGPFDAYISSHYNGGGTGFHAIYPDSTTGGVDVKANNPLDVRLCRAMKDRVKATNTVGLLSWRGWLDEPGAMSERETWVGSQGYRLGEFYGTMGFRETTARVIIEAGSINTAERQYIQNPAWVSGVYAPAIVDALEDVFGAFPVKDAGGDVGGQVPKPSTVYATPVAPDWAAPLRSGEAVYTVLPDGAVWHAVNRLYKARRNTPRKQFAFDTAKELNEPIPAGTVFLVDAVGTNAQGEAWGLTPWNTRVDMDDLELMPETPQNDLQAA